METTPDNRKTFLKISSLLTGYDETDLQSTGMVETYYNWVNMQAPQDVKFFYPEVDAILKECRGDEKALDTQIALRLIPLSCYNGLAQNIITMWYLGNWNGQVISPQSYVQGLVWPNADTHPFGSKQPGYGSWASPPVQVTNP